MKKLIFIGLVLLLSFQVFSANYTCDGDIYLENYTNENNINIQNSCYAIRFEYDEVLNNTVTFNLINNGYDSSKSFLIYDNSNENDYTNVSSNKYEFLFIGFNDLYFKYGSDYQLTISDYINRNKFIGTKNTNAKIEIENAVKEGRDYFIGGSINTWNNIELYFENFGVNDNTGEYRLFLNDINNVDVYVDNNNELSNEKILIIENNVGDVNINSINYNQDSFKIYRMNNIEYEEFMANGFDKIYMQSIVDTQNIVEKEEKSFIENIKQKTNEIYVENKTPVKFGFLGFLLVFITVLIVRKEDKFFAGKPQDMLYHIVIALMLSSFTLIFTKNLLIVTISTIVISSIMAMIYYRKSLTSDKLIKFLKYIALVIVFVTIIYYIYLLL